MIKSPFFFVLIVPINKFSGNLFPSPEVKTLSPSLILGKLFKFKISRYLSLFPETMIFKFFSNIIDGIFTVPSVIDINLDDVLPNSLINPNKEFS